MLTACEIEAVLTEHGKGDASPDPCVKPARQPELGRAVPTVRSAITERPVPLKIEAPRLNLSPKTKLG